MIMSVDSDDDFGRTDDQSSDGFDVENGGKILYIYQLYTDTCYPQEILHTCTKALFWSHAGSQGSPARGTGRYYRIYIGPLLNSLQ